MTEEKKRSARTPVKKTGAKTKRKKTQGKVTAGSRKRSTKEIKQDRKPNFWVIGLALIAVLDVFLVISMIGKNSGKEKIDYSQYPVAYTDLIHQYAPAAGLEEPYVASVILAESSYEPSAVSVDNAQGLMQIIPSTAAWIAEKLGENYWEGCLYDPETNIRYGCWYLGFLMDRYGGDKRCSSAAYHSGQGTVDDWLENPEYSADGKTLDVIPGKNAETYVNRIMRYYEIYDVLYQEMD